MSLVGNILKGVVGQVIPSISKTKAKINAVDTLLSKRGQVTKGEVIIAIASQMLTRVVIGTVIVVAILYGKDSIFSIAKLAFSGLL